MFGYLSRIRNIAKHCAAKLDSLTMWLDCFSALSDESFHKGRERGRENEREGGRRSGYLTRNGRTNCTRMRGGVKDFGCRQSAVAAAATRAQRAHSTVGTSQCIGGVN